MLPVIILGANILGSLALEVFSSSKMLVYCFLDDDKKLHGSQINEVTVMGDTKNERFLQMIGEDCHVFIAFEGREKKSYLELFPQKKSIQYVNAIHSQSMLSKNAILGQGNLFAMGTCVEEGVKMGEHNILQTGSLVSQKVSMGDYITLSTGVVIGSKVTLGDYVWIGTAAVISSGVTLGKNTKVLPGSVVTSSFGDNMIVQGNPAKIIS